MLKDSEQWLGVPNPYSSAHSVSAWIALHVDANGRWVAIATA